MPTPTAHDEVAAGGLLDADWYRQHYPDVARAGADPLDHLVRYGGAEGLTRARQRRRDAVVGQHAERLACPLTQPIPAREVER